MNAAATEVFDQEVNDMHLAQVFPNLSLGTGITDNQVTVTVTGDYLSGRAGAGTSGNGGADEDCGSG